MVTDQQIIEACESSITMAQAASKLEIHFNTLARRAKKLGVYKPNQGGKGLTKKSGKSLDLKEILNGKHPQYQTFKLKNRLIKEGIKDWKCEVCDLEKWNNDWIPLELDHIDGNRTNHRLENLRMICPNCHSQTETFRAKNI